MAIRWLVTDLRHGSAIRHGFGIRRRSEDGGEHPFACFVALRLAVIAGVMPGPESG
jgi:hypothetical protein